MYKVASLKIHLIYYIVEFIIVVYDDRFYIYSLIESNKKGRAIF